MATTTVGDPDAADRFFAAPRVDDPFASPPPLEPLAAMAPMDSSPTEPLAPPAAFDPAAFDPSTFDVGAFDPAPLDQGAVVADAVAEPEQPDLFATDAFGADDGAPFVADLGDDPAFAIEVVALGPDEPAAATVAPAEIEPLAPLAAEPGESWLATWETMSEHANGSDPDDPFAALRVPLEEVYGADVDVVETADPFGPEPGFGTPLTAATEIPTELPVETRGDASIDAIVVTPDADAFAHAYEPVVQAEATPLVEAEPMLTAAAPVPSDPFADPGVDDDPDGEWFDRAAAATAALVADHLQAEHHDESEATGDEPWVAEALAEAPTEHPIAAPAVAELVVDDAPADDAHEDTEDPEDPEDAALADALAAAPVAGLAPISWSLFPPAVTADETEDPIEHDTDAEPDDAPVPTDAQFVPAGTDWQIGGIFPATAMADDGTLALRRADVRWALADLVANDDFTARATVDFTSGAGFGILFRVSVDDSERISGYSFDVDPIYGGGGFLLRQWQDNRQHWKPLAHAPVADPTRLYGHHTIEVQLRADQLTASVDGEVVLTVRQLSRCSIDSGREPCRGARLGVQAWSTTEMTVDRLMLAS
jgi:hypothetical protein